MASLEILRNKIDQATGINIYPLNPSYITSKVVEELIPRELCLFLRSLYNVAKTYDTKITSVAQDIITLYSKGKKKMPKNVASGISLNNSLRTKEMITYVNNSGGSRLGIWGFIPSQ